MKTEEGIVIGVEGDLAKLKVGRHNDCKNCGACPSNNAVIMDVQNSISAKPGERVEIEIKETNALRAAFIVFMMPIFAIAVGAFMGAWIGGKVGSLKQIFEISGGATAFVMALLYIKLFDKSVNNNKNRPVITRIL